MAPTSENLPIRDGQILTGPLFSEPMRVETVRSNGAGSWVAGLVGTQTERFRNVALSANELAELTIIDTSLSYDGDGRLLRIGLEAHALGIAHEFDPYFGLSISRVDPLPHQLEAVYGHLLKLSTVRFLLADDAGAGKTIMAGLLVRELMLRGLAERILVVCPANLAFQWQRELREKFDEKFLVLKGSDIRDQFGVNQWMEQKRVITSLDLAKRDEILPGLRQVHWDLVIIDEAHRMSAQGRNSQEFALQAWRNSSREHRPYPVADRHAPQRRPEELRAISAAPGPGRLCRRQVHSRGHGPTPGALLPAPHQGGDGLFSGTPAERRVERASGVHQAHSADGRFQD